MTASVGGPLANTRVPKVVAGSKAEMLLSIFQCVPLHSNACVVYFAMPNKVGEAIEVLRSLQGDQQEASRGPSLTMLFKTTSGTSPMSKSRKCSAAQQIGTEEFFRLLKRASVRATSMHEIGHQRYSILKWHAR
jgi:hypothetical protein